MSLKAELETWAAALKAYDEEDFDESLELFNRIADSSKILFNMGLIYATLGEHETAVQRFMDATSLDQYLAVAYFQCGVSNFLLGRYDVAHTNFEEALLYLRGNQAINYEQLGLKFRLFSAEVLFNKGLALIYLGKTQEGMADMEDARRDKATDEHNVIDDAIRDQGEGYTVFSIPVGVLYRPSEKKLKNSVQKDYMGKAKLVASSDPNDAITTFIGSARLKQGITPTGIFVDRPATDSGPSPNLVRSATVPPVTIPPDNVRSGPKSAVERSKTYNTSADLRSGPASASPFSPGVTRKNTQIVPGRPSPNAGIGGSPANPAPPVRGLSVRRAGGPSSDNTRLTEFYDDYIDSYGQDQPAPPVPRNNTASPDRVGAWARNNANPPPLGRSGSRSAPNSSYAPSAYGGMNSVSGSVRRRPTRRNTRTPSRIQSTYEEEEEGYVSGDYDDAPFDLAIIRVKLHYQGDTRGMTLTPDVPFAEFMDKVTAKFEKSTTGLGLKFKDEDGGKVTLRDESDYEMAIETAREAAKGKPEGKLEIWCTDL